MLRLLCDRRDELSQRPGAGSEPAAPAVPGADARRRAGEEVRQPVQDDAAKGAATRSGRAGTAAGWPLEELEDIERVDVKLKAMKAELKAAVLATGSHLMDIHGIGPAGAARILADVGDMIRFPNRDHFAPGTAPPDRCLQRAAQPPPPVPARNRRINHVLYIAGISARNDTKAAAEDASGRARSFPIGPGRGAGGGLPARLRRGYGALKRRLHCLQPGLHQAGRSGPPARPGARR